MLAPVTLSRFTASVPIADANGRPTPIFLRYFNGVLGQVESAINGVITAQEAAAAAQAAANAAQDQAIAALAQAVSAASDAAAAQATADSKLSQTTADGLYVAQDATATWGSPTGTGDRTAFASFTAPTVSATPTQAQVQAIADAAQLASRHLVALIADLISNSAVKG